MVIDSSALVAILRDEPERDSFLRAIADAPVRLLSTASAMEVSIVILAMFGEPGLEDLSKLLPSLEIDLVPLTRDHYEEAVAAFLKFGKRRHPAALNFGDCFSYGLAATTREPILFKGNDFSRTDLTSAL